MENLADVLLGLCPNDLIAPRFFDPVRNVAHARLSFSDDGSVTQAVTHTPQPTQPSGFSTGCPRSSSASARSPMGQARAQPPHSAPSNVMQRCGSSSNTPMCTVLPGTFATPPVSPPPA